MIMSTPKSSCLACSVLTEIHSNKDVSCFQLLIGHSCCFYQNVWQTIRISASGGSRVFRKGGGRANPWVWSKNLIFDKIFPENCMKMKEIGPKGGEGARIPSSPLDPPMFHPRLTSDSTKSSRGSRISWGGGGAHQPHVSPFLSGKNPIQFQKSMRERGAPWSQRFLSKRTNIERIYCLRKFEIWRHLYCSICINFTTKTCNCTITLHKGKTHQNAPFIFYLINTTN